MFAKTGSIFTNTGYLADIKWSVKKPDSGWSIVQGHEVYEAVKEEENALNALQVAEEQVNY